MFASFISFRDFTLYVIPGNVTAYLILKIISLVDLNPFPSFMQGLSDNIGLLFIFVTVASFIGFLQSQIIIRLFNWLIENSKKSPYNLENAGMDKQLYDNSMAKMQRVFQLNSNFKFAPTHFLFCNSFVLSRTNEHSYGYARRLINFSLFSTVIPIPFTLSLYYISLKLNISLLWHWPIFAFLTVVIFYYCFRLSSNFRFQWIKTVLSLFLSLPEDK